MAMIAAYLCIIAAFLMFVLRARLGVLLASTEIVLQVYRSRSSR